MSLMDQQSMQAPQSGGDYAAAPAQPPTPYPSMTPNMSKGGTVPRRVQKFATGGYATNPISASATGMPAATGVGGYTPGPNSNAVGSWGASAGQGIPGSGGANYAPQGSPGANSWGGGPSNPSPVPTSQVGASAYGHGSPGYTAPTPPPQQSAGIGGSANTDSADPQSWYYGSKQQAQQESLYGNSAYGANSVANTPGESSYLPPKVADQYANPGSISSTGYKEGGPVLPGVKHTSKKAKPVKKFASGGPTDDSVPDPGGAIPSDPNDTSDTTDTGQGQQGQAGDLSGIAQQVKQSLSATRQQFGLNDQAFQQMAAQIPSAPAGPGGDQPNQNPFPTKTPSPPFGQAQAAPSDQQGIPT